jgi:hypothetical protein
MQSFFQKYKAIILLLFLGGYITVIDKLVLNGYFKGIEEQKHFVYIAALIVGLGVVLFLLLKEDSPSD